MGNCRRWPTSSAVDYWMRPAPQKTSSLSLSEQRRAPASGNTLCEGHERRRRAIRKMNTPEIAKEMKSLLGLSDYVSGIIPNFAAEAVRRLARAKVPC